MPSGILLAVCSLLIASGPCRILLQVLAGFSLVMRVAILAQVAWRHTFDAALRPKSFSRVLVFLLVAIVGEMAHVVIDSAEVKQECEKFLQGVKGAQAEWRVQKAMAFLETLDILSQDDLEGIEIGPMVGSNGQPIKSGLESFIRKAVDKATQLAAPPTQHDAYNSVAPHTLSGALLLFLLHLFLL